MALTSETGRYAQPKISFSCSCGKKYRVAASKAGKKVRCKGCRIKVTVPGGDRQISMRSRKAILAELGIDAEAAERAYEAEKESGYRCTVCDAKLADDQLKDAYGEAGLTCSDCRAAQIAERGADYKQDGEKKKKDKKLDKWTTARSAEEVRKKALGYAALFFAGTAGLASSVFGLGALGTVGVASAVAYVGYRTVFKAEYVAADAA